MTDPTTYPVPARHVVRVQTTWKGVPGADGAPPTLDLDGRPVVLTGPSGSGKSRWPEAVRLALTGEAPLPGRAAVRDATALALAFGGSASERGAVVTDNQGGIWTWAGAGGKKVETAAPAAVAALTIPALQAALAAGPDVAARQILALAGVRAGALISDLPPDTQAAVAAIVDKHGEGPADVAKALRALANSAKGAAERAAAAVRSARDLLATGAGESAPPTVEAVEAQIAKLTQARVQWLSTDADVQRLRDAVPGLPARKPALLAVENAAHALGAPMSPTTQAIARALDAVLAELPPAEHCDGPAGCPVCARGWDLRELRARCEAASTALARADEIDAIRADAAKRRADYDRDVAEATAAAARLHAAGIPLDAQGLPPATYTPQLPRIDAALAEARSALMRAQTRAAQTASAAEWEANAARTAAEAATAAAVADAWDARVTEVSAAVVGSVQAAVAVEAKACGVPTTLSVDGKGVRLLAPGPKALSDGQYAIAVGCLARALVAQRQDAVLPFLHLPDVQIDRDLLLRVMATWAANGGAPVWITTTMPLSAAMVPGWQLVSSWPEGAVSDDGDAALAATAPSKKTRKPRAKKANAAKAADAAAPVDAATGDGGAPPDDTPDPDALFTPEEVAGAVPVRTVPVADTAVAVAPGLPADMRADPDGLLAEWYRQWAGIPGAAEQRPTAPDGAVLRLIAATPPGAMVVTSVDAFGAALMQHDLHLHKGETLVAATARLIRNNPSWVGYDPANNARVIWRPWALNLSRAAAGRPFCSAYEWTIIESALKSRGGTAPVTEAPSAAATRLSALAEIDALLEGL